MGETGDWEIITTGTTKLRGKGAQEPRSLVLPPAPAEGAFNEGSMCSMTLERLDQPWIGKLSLEFS